MTDLSENKNTWGGAREGAGRKPLPKEQVSDRLNIYAPQALHQQIKQMVQKLKVQYYKKINKIAKI